MCLSLNPYCNGRWSRTRTEHLLWCKVIGVLILIVMEDGLVLIRILVLSYQMVGLNPYCNGRWSRTHVLIAGNFASVLS